MPDETTIQAELIRVLDALDRAEARLAAMDRQLEHAERLATLGTLVGGVAHEFNNILTPVMSYAQLALSEPDDPELARKALERAYKGAERASRVAASMLGFSRTADEPAICPVAECVQEAIETTRLDATHEKIALEIDVPDGLLAGIQCLALQQVLINLLVNARRAIHPNPGTIAVDARRFTWNTPGAPRPDAVEIHVRDTGHGIDDETRATLFTPFATGNAPASSTRPPGNGLGLAICKRLIDQAGGTIAVDSTPGAGTTFTVRVPVGDPALLEHGVAGTSAA